jgi:hypothetical protein
MFGEVTDLIGKLAQGHAPVPDPAPGLLDTKLLRVNSWGMEVSGPRAQEEDLV